MIILTLSEAATSAPFSRSALTTCERPPAAACMRGVHPPYKKKTGIWFEKRFVTGPMAIRRDMYEKIRANAHEFCEFDDYNWYARNHLGFVENESVI